MTHYRIDQEINFTGTLLQASKTYTSDNKLEKRIQAVASGMIAAGWTGGSWVKIIAMKKRDKDCGLSERLFTIAIHELEWSPDSKDNLNGRDCGEYVSKRIVHGEKFYEAP